MALRIRSMMEIVCQGSRRCLVIMADIKDQRDQDSAMTGWMDEHVLFHRDADMALFLPSALTV